MMDRNILEALLEKIRKGDRLEIKHGNRIGVYYFRKACSSVSRQTEPYLVVHTNPDDVRKKRKDFEYTETIIPYYEIDRIVSMGRASTGK
jgi:hypothetical protein